MSLPRPGIKGLEEWASAFVRDVERKFNEYDIKLGELVATATFDPGSLNDAAGATTTVAVPGAAPGDFVQVAFTTPLAGVLMTAWVSAVNEVSVRFQNESGTTVDLASGTLQIKVRKP